MPVYHRLQQLPEMEGEEYYRPLDGVRPTDHPATYEPLQSLRCIRLLDEILYQRNSDNYKICQDCYPTIPEEEQSAYGSVVPHCLVYWTSAYTQTNCTMCGKAVIKVIHADQCMGCIEEYLDADLDLLRSGWGVPVAARDWPR